MRRVSFSLPAHLGSVAADTAMPLVEHAYAALPVDATRRLDRLMTA
jgi:hypothetical protein